LKLILFKNQHCFGGFQNILQLTLEEDYGRAKNIYWWDLNTVTIVKPDSPVLEWPFCGKKLCLVFEWVKLIQNRTKNKIFH
jgi:hypothetical protein